MENRAVDFFLGLLCREIWGILCASKINWFCVLTFCSPNECYEKVDGLRLLMKTCSLTQIDKQQWLGLHLAEICCWKWPCFQIKCGVSLGRGGLERSRRSRSNPLFLSFRMVYRLLGEKTNQFSKMGWRYLLLACSNPAPPMYWLLSVTGENDF